MGDAPKTSGDSLSRVVARGAGVTWVSGLAVQSILLVTYVGLARLAAPAVFGTFAAASILVTVGALFVESGMTSALVHRRDRIDEAAATAFVSTALGGLGLAVLSAALAPVVGLLFEGEDITELAFAIAGVHILNSLTVVPNALLQRDFAYVRRAFVDPLWMGTYGGVAAVLLWAGWGPWALVTATYAAALVRAIVVWSLLRRRLPLRSASFALWRELAAYGRHVLAGEFLRHAGVIAHTAGIGRFLGTTDLGQFNFGNQIANQSGSPIVTASANVLFPAFTRMTGDDARVASAFKRALGSLAFLTVPVSLGFLAFGVPLAVLLLGDQWRAAGEVLSSLCLVGAALAFISISTELLKAIGRPQYLPRIHFLSALAPIVAVVTGVWFGIVVVGALTSVGLTLTAAFALWIAGRNIGVPFRALLGVVARTFVVAAVVAATFFVFEREVVRASERGTLVGLGLLAGEAAVAACAYVGLMRLAAPRTTTEFAAAVRHLRRRRDG